MLKSLVCATTFMTGLLGPLAFADAAEITPLSQARQVSASADGWVEGKSELSDSDSDAAADFGVFDSTVTAGIGVAGAAAYQSSMIGTQSIQLDGSAAASGTTGACPPHFGGGTAQSVFDVTFDVDEATAYSLAFFVTTVKARASGSSSVSFSLVGPAGFDSVTDDVTTTDVASALVSGTMIAGTYTLTVSTQCVAGNNNDAQASYSAALQLGEPDPLTPLVGLNVISTDRAISANTNAGCPDCPPDFCLSELFVDGTTGLELFDSSVIAHTNGGASGADASAWQRSEVAAHAVFARGLIAGSSGALTKGGCFANSGADSEAGFTFLVSEPVVVEVLATVANASVTLSGHGTLADGNGHVHERLSLTPGLYELSVALSVSTSPPFCVDQDGEQGAYDVVLVATTDVPLCGMDFNGDNEVNVVDLLELIGHWGVCDAPLPILCPWDVDRDGEVGVTDLLTLLVEWGPCV